MNKLWYLGVGLSCFLCPAQNSESGLWLFYSHRQKVHQKVEILADVQLRLADQFQYISTILLRPALNYTFNDRHSAALGYAFKADWERADDMRNSSVEHRIFEQYLFLPKIKRSEVMVRTRLEQRWIQEDHRLFSQRLRQMAGIQVPVFADPAFTKGWYVSVQDEIFINVDNKSDVNGSVYDQNRSYLAAGYRFNKNIDTEIGYQFWNQKEADGTYNRHIIQVMVTGNF